MKKFLTALLAGAMILTGCGGSKGDDEVVFHDWFVMGGDFSTLNYLNSSAAANTRVFNQCISGLLDTDEYGNLVGDMAEEWTHNEDYTQWTFKLREGLKWANRDGSEYAPLVAQDWVTALEWELTAANASTCTEMATTHLVNANEFLNGEETDFSKVGVTAVDDTTVVFDLKIPAPWFDTVVLYSSFYPLNADFLAEKGEDFGNGPDTILYNGAYLMTEYTNDQEKVFEKNPLYWDVENVKVDKAISIAIKDTESSKELFERGELDWCQLAGTQPIKAYEDGNEYVYQSDPVICAYCLFMNGDCSDTNTATAFQNENFRKAIFYGWDRNEFVSQTDPINPESIYTWTYTPKGFVTTSDGTDYTELGDLAQWQENKYDHDLGMEYFNKAKEELGSTVTWPIEIPYWTKAGNETASNTAIVFKATLEEAFGAENVTLNIQEYSVSARSEVYNLNNQGFSSAGWIPDYKDPANQLGSVVPGPTGYMNGEGTNGMSHWLYPEFVEMYNEACAETADLDKRYELFANAEAYLFEHAYFIPLYQANATYRMTRYNPYSRTFSTTGGTEYRYKRIEIREDIYTAEEIANLKAEWLSKK